MISDDELFVTLEHMHSVPAFNGRAGFCHKGGRALAARYGLDWGQIVSDGGIVASKLVATGDAMALHLVEFARQEVGDGQ
ncbi:hypothetical protein ACU4EH_13245 [Pseudomonas aeruginosa]|uniref:hypothetical protein n=1 Tax=Pseudomonas aeruginosa TaxID=287 RepID=UPI001EDABA89|nr:hypothetical protein [Pseudomonas aeruginosa]MCG3008990.1 hypothetical protein [Pseudomonas aeruginosa]MCV6567134.1 hypothetical protein [Pseudomonas aeruginosa]